MNNAYGKYLKAEVEGASKGRLIVMMYDAAVRFMHEAVKAIEEKDIESAHNNIIRTENIIYELMSTLNIDEGGEVADNLLRLYDYMIWELVDANSSKSIEKVENVIKVIMPLRAAWKEIVAREEAPRKAAAEAEKAPAEHKSINFSG